MESSLARSLVLGVALAACSDSPSTLSGTSSSSGGSGAASSSSGASGSTGGSAEEICVATMNEYRAAKGLAPYARWTDNEACTANQASADGNSGGAHGAFGKCGETAQTECPGWPGPAETMIPKCLKAMMGEGPGGGHHDAIMNPTYTKVACGFAAASGGAIWSTQNFR